MIVVFGSINIDLIIAAPTLPAPGETVIGESYRLAPGGKGANQALAAARDGAQVMLVGAVGKDGFADTALSLLRTAGVELSLFESDDRPTGCAAITVAAGGENMITVAAGANRLARADSVPDAVLGPDTIVLVQMEVPPAEVAQLVERAKARGGRVILNLAPAMPLSVDMFQKIDVLVANETEAASLDHAPADLAVANQLVLVITRGGRGASAYLQDGSEIVVPALAVTAIDTTGAGDTFVGVLAAALDADLPLAAALHRASTAAGLSCLLPGAQPSMPVRAAIDAAIARAAPSP